jgi:hypothetical protein
MHLEAAAQGIPSMAFPWVGDHYGYIASGLTERADFSSLEHSLVSTSGTCRDLVRTKAKPFFADVGTLYEGQAAKTLASVINDALNERSGAAFPHKSHAMVPDKARCSRFGAEIYTYSSGSLDMEEAG